MKKIAKIAKEKWNYILIACLPWVLIVVHSLVRQSWLTGEGSILAGDSGSLYVELYTQLWEKIHSGQSLLFSWNAGLGVEFGLAALKYLISPFSLLVLILPKAWIANVVQFIMVLKWSCAAVTVLFFLTHTKHNQIRKCKKWITFSLAAAFSLGNMLLSNLGNLKEMDVLIVFPLILLCVERFSENRYRKWLYFLLTLCFMFDTEYILVIFLFSILWYLIYCGEQEDNGQTGNKRLGSLAGLVGVQVLALLTSMVVWLPTLTNKMTSLFQGTRYALNSIASFTRLFNRLFWLDTPSLADSGYPHLYCSALLLMLALLYVFVEKGTAKKIFGVGSAVLLTVCMAAGIENINLIACFLIVFFALQVMGKLENLRIWHVIVVAVFTVGSWVLVFFNTALFEDFYVYLGTLLIVVFTLLLLFFCCRKSIKPENLLICFSVVVCLEVASNAYIQLEEYNMYTFDDTYYNSNAEELSQDVSVSLGERVAVNQTMRNYGMVVNLPSPSSEDGIVADGIYALYQGLGLSVGASGCEYSGATPLTNLMFNVRYGMAQNEVVFGDVTDNQTDNDYNLYEMNGLAGLGYVVNSDVTQWNVEQDSPFDVQNDFISKATGVGQVFQVITPEAHCESVTGINEYDTHNHPEGEECDEVYYGEYTEDDTYYYHYRKMYSNDVVSFKFTSDGTTDYYVFVKGIDESYTSVMIGDDLVYEDTTSGKQKLLHIGVVDKGTEITIMSLGIIDNITETTLHYQVAAFDAAAYEKAYEVLCSNVWNVEKMTETGVVSGTLETADSGILLTGIPAYKGFQVVLDGEKVSYTSIGGALIGIPVEAGEHTIVIEYHIPYMKLALLGTILGIIIFVLCVFMGNGKQSVIEKSE
jgi:uncharacterized membrane protein YfhO